MNHKFPFLNVIAASLYYALSNKADLLRAIALPTLVIAVAWALATALQNEQPGMLLWLVLPVYGLGFSFFAVTCHRLILVESQSRSRHFREKPGYRELRFLGWVVVVYGITSLFKALLVLVLLNMWGKGAAAESGQASYWLMETAISIPAWYVLARLCMVFPAAAIDRRVSLRWSWERTRGNGWRLFFVVGLFPWLIEHGLDSLAREGMTSVEWLLLAIFTFIGLAVGIIALSFSYVEIEKQVA